MQHNNEQLKKTSSKSYWFKEYFEVPVGATFEKIPGKSGKSKSYQKLLCYTDKNGNLCKEVVLICRNTRDRYCMKKVASADCEQVSRYRGTLHLNKDDGTNRIPVFLDHATNRSLYSYLVDQDGNDIKLRKDQVIVSGETRGKEARGVLFAYYIIDKNGEFRPAYTAKHKNDKYFPRYITPEIVQQVSDERKRLYELSQQISHIANALSILGKRKTHEPLVDNQENENNACRERAKTNLEKAIIPQVVQNARDKHRELYELGKDLRIQRIDMIDGRKITTRHTQLSISTQDDDSLTATHQYYHTQNNFALFQDNAANITHDNSNTPAELSEEPLPDPNDEYDIDYWRKNSW